jgi:hypothetical protein
MLPKPATRALTSCVITRANPPLTPHRLDALSWWQPFGIHVALTQA